MDRPEAKTLGRRDFLASAAAAAAVTIVRPSAVRGSQANSTLELGAIGCGGRGQWITDLFQKHGKYRYVACADYFQDRVDCARQENGGAGGRPLHGLIRLQASAGAEPRCRGDRDAPLFPSRARGRGRRGRQTRVYRQAHRRRRARLLEHWPVGQEEAREKKLVFLVDFQTRANAAFRETARRIHAGQIGRIVCAEGRYPTGGLASNVTFKTPDDRLRYWYTIKELSGDFIVEQSIHALDVATWFLDAAPLQAMGTGGKRARPNADIWDHFSLIYSFPDDVPLTFTCLQAIPNATDEISCSVFGCDGMAFGNYWSEAWIHGKHPYAGAKWKDLLYGRHRDQHRRFLPRRDRRRLRQSDRGALRASQPDGRLGPDGRL